MKLSKKNLLTYIIIILFCNNKGKVHKYYYIQINIYIYCLYYIYILIYFNLK